MTLTYIELEELIKKTREVHLNPAERNKIADMLVGLLKFRMIVMEGILGYKLTNQGKKDYIGALLKQDDKLTAIVQRSI